MTKSLVLTWAVISAFRYCDGASFSGDKTEPFMYNTSTGTQPLYFRGRRVLDAVLDTLLAEHGLDQATDVLLSGGSAGGLSTCKDESRCSPKSISNCSRWPWRRFFFSFSFPLEIFNCVHRRLFPSVARFLSFF